MNIKKEEIRKIMINKRNNLSEEYIEKSNKSILEKIKDYISKYNKKNIFIYMDMSNEVKVSQLINMLPNVDFYIPKTFPNRKMKITKFDENNLIKHKFGYYEVDTENFYDEQVLDLIIMPAIAIDKNKNRIGFGGGYYDTFLSNLIKNHNAQQTPTPDILAVCYDFQIVDNIQAEPHDIKPNYVVTESIFF